MNDNIKKIAFSLAEALITLLMVSIILAVLAPIMSKRMKLTQTGFSSFVKPKPNILRFDDPAKNGTNENVFEVPQGLTNAVVTVIAGGGGGGNAIMGSQVFTGNTLNWTVPEGVTKVRVYMVGGGGSGASGGVDTTFFTVPAGGYVQWTTPGEYVFDGKLTGATTSFTKPGTCANGDWELNASAASPQPVNVTACGGGGGGGGGPHLPSGSPQIQGKNGASGGHVENESLELKKSLLTVQVGGGGGSGGAGGCSISLNTVIDAQGYGGGGGGSGHSAVRAGSGVGFGGQGSSWTGAGQGAKDGGVNGSTCYGGNGKGGALNAGGTTFSVSSGCAGGGGGGGEQGGGGGGSGYYSCTTAGGGGGGGATRIVETPMLVGGGGGGAGGGFYYSSSWFSGGAGGGGGGTAKGGKGGNYDANSSPQPGVGGLPNGSQSGSINTIFSSNYCNGGSGGTIAYNGAYGTQGKPGALRITWPKDTQAFKCGTGTSINAKFGAGGGGGGQVWLGEIDVPADRKLNFVVGVGGVSQTSYGANGNTGVQTKITNSSNTVLAYANGGGGGRYNSDPAQINNTYGVGGGQNAVNWKDWTGLNIQGGINGANGTLNSGDVGGTGGNGGNTSFKDGVLMKGGGGGGAATNGNAPTGNVYGAGGGGGGGANKGSTAGTGAAGADGYIYIEWGGSNAGGGSSGQVIDRKVITNLKYKEQVSITVGKGGLNSVDKTLGKGSDSEFGTYVTALGGNRGEDGGMGIGIHGKGGLSSGVGSLPGTDGLDNFGGIGGDAKYQLSELIEGLGGCGGNVITSICNGFTELSPQGKQGSKPGAGGGGGAMKNGVPYKGGDGADGLVVVEWE